MTDEIRRELTIGKEYSLNGGHWRYLRKGDKYYEFSRLIEIIESFFTTDKEIEWINQDRINATGKTMQTFRDGRNDGWERKRFLVRASDLEMAHLDYEDSLEEKAK